MQVHAPAAHGISHSLQLHLEISIGQQGFLGIPCIRRNKKSTLPSASSYFIWDPIRLLKNFRKISFLFIFRKRGRALALAGVAQWIEHQPVNRRVAGSIPSLGHMPVLRARSPVWGA